MTRLLEEHYNLYREVGLSNLFPTFPRRGAVADFLQRMLSDTLAVITRSTGDALLISFLILLFFGSLVISYWIYNRRKFQSLSHQIPATVVKNYLDSVIQNSEALKNSLFRGGGLEVGQGVPSVMPVGDLPSGGVSTGGPSQEELNQKLAEISALRGQLGEKDGIIRDLEAKLADAQAAMASGDQGEQISGLMADKDKLAADLKAAQDALATAQESSGGDEGLKAELDSVTKDRNLLKDKLAEYEIIEEDLANLKKLKKENDELKAELAGLKGGAAPAPTPEPAAAPEPPTPTPTPESAAAPEPPAQEAEEDLEAAMAAAITDDDKAGVVPEKSEPVEEDGEEKSAEELLSEFEKMLG